MPGTPTVPDGLRWPVDTDSPDIPRDFKNLADDTQAALTRVGMQKFASAAARDAAIPTPAQGSIVFRTDRLWAEMYVGTSWNPIYGRVPRAMVLAPTKSNFPVMTWTIVPFTSIPEGVHTDLFTLNADGSVTFNQDGIYDVSLALRFQATTGVIDGVFGQMTFTNAPPSSTSARFAITGAGTDARGTTSLNAPWQIGQKIYVWAMVSPAAVRLLEGELFISYIGPTGT